MPRLFCPLPAKAPDRPGRWASGPVAARAGSGPGSAQGAVVGRETGRAR